MNTKKFFNFKLYFTGIKELILLNVITLFLFILDFTVLKLSEGDAPTQMIIPYLVAIFSHIILVPMMAISTYKYVANPSKFNSTEYSKASVVVSFTMSLLTCSLIMTLNIIPSLIYSNWPNKILYFIGFLSAYLFVVAAFFFAWTLAKNLLAFMGISLITLSLPIISIIVYQICPSLDYERISCLFNSEYTQYNLRTYDYSYIPGIIFTLGFSLVLTLVGILILRKNDK